MPARQAADPLSTLPTMAGFSCTPCMYAATKQPMPRIMFMTTPAEMMSIRWPTVFFLKLRGSSSASSPSAVVALADHPDVPAERDDPDHVSGLAPLVRAERHGRAEPDAERLDVDVAPLGGEEVAEFVDEDDEPEPEHHLEGLRVEVE